MLRKLLPALLLLQTINSTAQTTKQLTIFTDSVKATVQPTMWGIFIEDINFAADGGLYAELVKNRSFEFEKPLMGWKVETRSELMPRIVVVNRKENSNNPRFAHITIDKAHPFSMINEGFRGMGIKKGNTYQFSVWAKTNAITQGNMTLTLQNSGGKEIGTGKVTITDTAWKQYSVSITTTDSALRGSMRLQLFGNGDYDLDMISLFPGDTWKQRPNGLRADLVQLLADLKPGFIRFPGGCIVEGVDLNNRYQWKSTVGDIRERKSIINRWNKEFPSRNTPDYFQSYGLGFYEYFLLSEDLGAQPLPILNCGMACQYNTAEAASVTDLDPYIQDALDLIEFANGDVQTQWGKLRAKMGHPQPFNLTMLGIGNEQWGPQYLERMSLFRDAIKKKYPNIKLVYSTGTAPDGQRFDYLNDTLRKQKADLLDEHYYMKPDWFLKNAGRYDGYDRKNASKVFAGEYAVRSETNVNGPRKNNWEAALAEAAFMTGLERNADVVSMASYAPLLAHVDAWQWTPDLIWFDNVNAYPTPNYYVQQLFSVNKGNKVVPVWMDGNTPTGQDSIYASAVIDNATKELVVKLVNTSAKTQKLQLNSAKHKWGKLVTGTLLSASQLMTTEVLPENITFSASADKMMIDAKPYSFYMLRVKL